MSQKPRKPAKKIVDEEVKEDEDLEDEVGEVSEEEEIDILKSRKKKLKYMSSNLIYSRNITLADV